MPTVTATLTVQCDLTCAVCHEPCGASYSGQEHFVECLGCALEHEERCAAAVAEFEAREQSEGWGPCPLCARMIANGEPMRYSGIDGGPVHLACWQKAEAEAAAAPCAYCGGPVESEESRDDFRFLQVNDPACLTCLQGLAAEHPHGPHAGAC